MLCIHISIHIVLSGVYWTPWQWRRLAVTCSRHNKILGNTNTNGHKCTLVQAVRLCTGHTAHLGNRGIALPFLDHGTRSGWGVSVTPRPLFTPGKDSVPIVQEAGWVPGPVWTGAKNLAPTGIRSPDRPTRSQSLYRLSYPAIEHSWLQLNDSLELCTVEIKHYIIISRQEA
jgi:hypothetical protein